MAFGIVLEYSQLSNLMNFSITKIKTTMPDVAIKGVESMTLQQIQAEVNSGAKFILFQYCISIGIMTFRRSSAVYLIRDGESVLQKGLKYTFTTLFLGWWGFPWGLIYTPAVLYKNLSGGKDVTEPVMSHFQGSMSEHLDLAEAA